MPAIRCPLGPARETRRSDGRARTTSPTSRRPVDRKIVEDMIPDWAKQARAKWHYVGTERPPFADEPKPGQESVWAYPRPPRIDPDAREIVVRVGDTVIARSPRPPGPGDRKPADDLSAARGRRSDAARAVAWRVAVRVERRRPLLDRRHAIPPVRTRGVVVSRSPARIRSASRLPSFYPGRLECYVNGERVRPQPGVFYGGWITSEVVGPFKGAPGTEAW